MSSSLLKRFQASRESAPVESPLDKPASIHDDAGKVVAAVEPAAPTSSNSGPGLHAAGLPAEPVTKPVDAKGVAKDECADEHVVAAVKPAKPTSSDASGLPGAPVKEPKADAAAVADDKADAEGKTVAAVQSVTPHHAQEDLDPEAAQVQPAYCIVPTPDHARETEATYRAVEEATMTHAVEELDRVQAGLEGLRDRIDTANAAGGLSAESAFFASFAVESLLKRFEIKDKAIVGSFESAVVVPDGKTVVSTEALEATLEAVDGFGKRLKASFVRALNPVWTRVKMLGASLASVEEEAKKVKVAGRLPTIEVKSKLIAEGDEPSKNLPASFSKAAEVLKYMVNGFGRQAEQDYRANMDLMWKHVYKKFHDSDAVGSAAWEGVTVEEITKAMEEIAAGWKDPRVKIGGDVTQPLIGNWQLFAEEKDEDSGAEYRGSNAAVKKLKDLAYKAYPTMAGSAHSAGNANSGVMVEVPALSPQEIVKIARAFQSATANFSAWKAFTEKVSGATTLAAIFGPAAVLMAGPYMLPAYAAWVAILVSKTFKRSTHSTGSEMQEFHILWHVQNTANRLRFHVGYDAGLVLTHIGNAFVKIAKQSLNAYAKASVEAFDQQNSLDGVSVNETAPNEPRQVPAEGHTATEKELMAKQDSWEDQPASFQTIEDEVSCESLIEEAKEIAVLQNHYALEAEGAMAETEKKAFHVKAWEKIKAFFKKVAEFFKRAGKAILKWLKARAEFIEAKVESLKDRAYGNVDIEAAGQAAHVLETLKVPDFGHFVRWMHQSGQVLTESALRLSQLRIDERQLARIHRGWGDLVTDQAIPATDVEGAFKIEMEQRDLVKHSAEIHFEKEARRKVTKQEVDAFGAEAAKAIRVIHLLAERQEDIADDFERAYEKFSGNDHFQMDNDNHRYFIELAKDLLQVGMLRKQAMQAFGGWEAAVSEVLSKVEAASKPKVKAEEAKPSAESRADLPYWYRPLEV